MHEKKHHPRKYEDTTSNLLKRNTSSGNPGSTKRFFDLVEKSKFKPKNYVTGRCVLTIKTDEARQLFQGEG